MLHSRVSNWLSIILLLGYWNHHWRALTASFERRKCNACISEYCRLYFFLQKSYGITHLILVMSLKTFIITKKIINLIPKWRINLNIFTNVLFRTMSVRCISFGFQNNQVRYQTSPNIYNKDRAHETRKDYIVIVVYGYWRDTKVINKCTEIC